MSLDDIMCAYPFWWSIILNLTILLSFIPFRWISFNDGHNKQTDKLQIQLCSDISITMFWLINTYIYIIKIIIISLSISQVCIYFIFLISKILSILSGLQSSFFFFFVCYYFNDLYFVQIVWLTIILPIIELY